jgi:hypothetical protein
VEGEWWQRDWIYRLTELAGLLKRKGEVVPRTTPPFQTTNPAKDTRRAIYGQSRVTRSKGRQIAATTILTGQSTKP